MTRQVAGVLLLCVALAGCAAQAESPARATVVPTQIDVEPTAAGETESGEDGDRAVAAPGGGEAVPGQVEVIGGDEDALRDLVGRLVSPGYPGAPGEPGRVLVGSLPDDLAVDLPVPPGSRIIGSVLLDPAQGGTQVFVEADLSPGEAVAFYADALDGAGWTDVSEATGPPPSGFVTQPQLEMGSYCDADDRYLSMTVLGSGDGPSDIRLYLQTSSRFTPCGSLERMGAMGAPFDLIPALVAPPGVVVVGGGGGGGGGGGSGRAYVSADLITEMAASALADHYNDQLEAAGWQPIDGGGGDGLAWSTWSLSDDQGEVWGGILVVAESPVAGDQRFAWLDVVPAASTP